VDTLFALQAPNAGAHERRDGEAFEDFAMARWFCAGALAAFVFSFSAAAKANILVQINRRTQTMQVSIDGVPRYSWRVSTGRAGLGTPAGTFHPQTLARSWFSRKYHNSPMPHSIFFHGGIAIHGSYETAWLGRAVSHGCVRLLPGNATTLFGLVQREGMGATTIVVH
jgi:lipoprotein-anchoring transpeptidase ErfK/SrfK